MEVESRRALGSRYELLTPLGQGAMGQVWRARDRTDDSVVAAKLLRPELTSDPQVVARFVQERSILVALDHPGIVRVRDLVVEGNDLAIVMDLVDGDDLRTRLREHGTLPPRLAVEVTCAVLDALAAAHAAGCLHRDVKPDNVLVAGTGDFGPEDVRLSDFSIARLAQDSTVLATGLLGTPGYMPPELFVHGTFSAASDVYAAGILLYELLAGRTPFAGPGTAHTVGHRHVAMAPPRLQIPDGLWRTVATMLSKDPALRLPAARTAEQLRGLPEETLDATQLPVQPEPPQWQPVDAAAPSAPIRVNEVPADVDVGATFVPLSDAAAAPVARTGAVEAVLPVAGVDLQETGLARSVGPASRPVLEPQAVVPEERRRRPWVRWVVALGVIAVLGGVGWLLVGMFGGGSDDDPGASPGGPVTATLIDDPLASGLSITRQVEYDPASGVADLTIRYGAQTAALAGPALEVLPPSSEGEQCPLVAWESDAEVSANLPQVSGIAVPCGHAVELPEVPVQGSVQVRAEVSVELPADDGAVEDWLRSASQSTANALAAQSVGAAYPAQRLVDVAVDVPNDVRVGSGSLRVRLLPLWQGAERPDEVNVLYDSEAVGPTSELLRQVAGGPDGVRLSDGCNGALAIVNGRRVGVLRAAEGCTVRVRLGNFTDLSSNIFRISRAGG